MPDKYVTGQVRWLQTSTLTNNKPDQSPPRVSKMAMTAEQRSIAGSPLLSCCLTSVEAHRVLPIQAAWQQYSRVILTWSFLLTPPLQEDTSTPGKVVSRLQDTMVRIRFAGGTVDLSVTDLCCLERAEGPCAWRVVDVAQLEIESRYTVIHI